MAPAGDSGKTFYCSYVVTDSNTVGERQRTSFGLRLDVIATVFVLPDPAAAELMKLQELQVGEFHTLQLPEAMGGVAPYTYALTCAGGSLPPGMGFEAATRVLAGTPTAAFRDTCAYIATDSSQPAARGSQTFQVTVTPLDHEGTWRFRTRTVAQNRHPVDLNDAERCEKQASVITLPHAICEPDDDCEGEEVKYDFLPKVRPHLLFGEEFQDMGGMERQLCYQPADPPGAVPVFNTPTTYRYRAYRLGWINEDNGECTSAGVQPPDFTACKHVQDVLCVDVAFHDENPADSDKTDGVLSTMSVWIRDDAFLLSSGEYRCPDAPPESSSSRAMTSNPVHLALGPVHARRAVDVAHAAVRDRVRGWSPGAREGWTLSPAVDVASLSGVSGGFDYTGSSRSLRVGTESGADAWQTGLVAALTETELRYRAEADLAQLAYRAGEHDTGIVSLHPFVAWHVPSGGHLWMSIGAGVGQLQHRDAPAFPSLSSSDIRLQTYALEATLPVADVMQGRLDAEAGVASFAFDIRGGDQISAEIPTLRGRDYRAGLAWNSPGPGAPSVALAYRQLTGDGPEGALLEVQGGVSAAGLLNIPRFSLKGTVTASLGLRDHEQESLSIGASARFAPGRAGRGFDASLDTRLASSADGRPTGLGLQGEAGYGFWGGPFFGMIRTYAGLLASPGGGSNRRAIGLDLLGMSRALVNVEVYDRHPVSGGQLNLYRRF